MGLFGFAIKTGITGGVIYYTTQEGLWSNPEESMKFYEKMYKNTCPFVKKNLPINVINEVPDIPNMNDIGNLLCRTWNRGVVVSIKFLSELPNHTKNGVDMIKNEIEKRNNTTNTPSNPPATTQ